ncbi:MAG: sigma-54 dependent transcriptional regulator [Planctomycetota bacterium]|nr:sigma-54 dependent transcriptional regulator [Planctomycetota bacterium]
MFGRILIVDDEVEVGLSLTKLFRSEGMECECAASAEEAHAVLVRNPDIRLVFLDVRMPGTDGISFLKAAKQEFRRCNIVMISAYPALPDTVQAMKLGATNFFSKPLDLDRILTEAKGLLGSGEDFGENDRGIVSRDPGIAKMQKQIVTAAPTSVPVIITGESGTGKELVAEQLHRFSDRRDRPLVKINCAAIPQNLLESELFGHEKGAFTDAKAKRIGKFERANGGTVFLDEIGDMTLPTQAKILRAIQEGEIEPLGGDHTVKVDIRVISATHRNIEKMIAAGDFREDLYYRLSVIGFHLPPLREREDDIELLIDHFIGQFSSQYGKRIAGVMPDVLERLRRHSWPGNVRELRNCIQRAVIFADGDRLCIGDLPDQYARLSEIAAVGTYAEGYRSAIDAAEKDIILHALEENRGVKGKAADALHIHRKTLYNRMKKLGIDG